MQRRQFTLLPAAAGTLLAGGALAPRATRAQEAIFPQKPVTLLLPFPAGTTPDIVARILAESLQQELGQPIIVDNRGGAGGIIGTQLVAKAPADGYTLLMGSVSTHAVNRTLYKSLPYDPVKDFAPVILLTKAPNTVLVNRELPVRSVAELIAHAKAHPGKLSYGSSGNGTSQHLAGEMFKSQAGIDMVHVPYKGGAAALTDLRAGQVQVMFEVLPSALSFVKADTVRILGVSSARRVPMLAEVPTVIEAGLPGYEVTTWHGLLAPAATPRPVVARLNTAIERAMNKEPFRQKIEDLGFLISTGTPEAFAGFMAAESERWSAIVRSSGARVD